LTSPDMVLGAFVNFYKDLYSTQSKDHFDENFKRETEHIFKDMMTESYKHNQSTFETNINIHELNTILSKLKRRKAPGWDLIQNEHILLGGTTLRTVLLKLYNAILELEIVPKSWKKGLIIPIFKGQGKSRSSVENYRPVTLLPVLYKIYEKIIQGRITNFLELNNIPFPNRQQQGFQPSLSCVSTAFLVQEVIQYNIDNGSCTYAAFLDTRRAFDSVWHCALFVKLYNLGINGKLWRIIVEMYKDILSAIYINKRQSSWFPVFQGVRQGGVLSTFLFLVYLNDLLHDIENSHKGAHIGTLNCSCPTYADDMSLLANSPDALQALMNIVFRYYCKFRLDMNVDKSCVIVFGQTRKLANKTIDIKFGTKRIPQKHSVIHLGILQDATRSTIDRTRDICTKARNAFYAMADIGVHPYGLNVETSINMYRKVVIPIVTYGCEIWNNLKHSDYIELNKFQHHVVKKIQGFHQYVRSDMCESMVGLYRIQAEIDRRKLLFFRRLCTLSSNTLATQIFLFKLFMYLDSGGSDSGFTSDIWLLLSKYNLTHYIASYLNTMELPSKLQWKHVVNKAVFEYEQRQWLLRVNSDADFERFKILQSKIGIASLYNISCMPNKKLIVHIARLWTMKPSLQRVCDFCQLSVRDLLAHLLCDCSCTRPYMNQFYSSVLYNHGFDIYTEFVSSSRENFIVKLLSLKFENEISDETFAGLVVLCFKTLETVTKGISLY
ncbi:MAG: reverse transcriptase family protein, partial [Candidatus Thiodiazotropha sp.]